MKISGCSIGTHLARLTELQDSAQIADAADAHWNSIRRALSPIIGMQGVASLYRRSVYLARVRYPWLPEPGPSELPSKPLDSLRSALLQQTPGDAAAAQLALLQIFNDLLENLIGGSLTGRLLDPVWQDAPVPHAAGEKTEDRIP